MVVSDLVKGLAWQFNGGWPDIVGQMFFLLILLHINH